MGFQAKQIEFDNDKQAFFVEQTGKIIDDFRKGFNFPE